MLHTSRDQRMRACIHFRRGQEYKHCFTSLAMNPHIPAVSLTVGSRRDYLTFVYLDASRAASIPKFAKIEHAYGPRFKTEPDFERDGRR